jgi:hypothetical protein
MVHGVGLVSGFSQFGCPMIIIIKVLHHCCAITYSLQCRGQRSVTRENSNRSSSLINLNSVSYRPLSPLEPPTPVLAIVDPYAILRPPATVTRIPLFYPFFLPFVVLFSSEDCFNHFCGTIYSLISYSSHPTHFVWYSEILYDHFVVFVTLSHSISLGL